MPTYLDENGNPIGSGVTYLDEMGNPIRQQEEDAGNGGFLGMVRGFDRTVANAAVGAAKGIGSTVYGLGSLASKIPGISQLSGALGASPEYAGFDEEKPGALTPRGTAQGVGYGAEQLVEFFVPATKLAKTGLAAKGASLGARTLGRLGNIGANAAADAAVTTAQGSGDPTGAFLGSASIQGALGVTGKAAGAAWSGAKRLMTGVPDTELGRLAQKFAVPLTKGQQFTGTVVRATESIVRALPFSRGIFREPDLVAEGAIQKAGQKIGAMIGGKPLEGLAFKDFIETTARDVRRAAGEAFGKEVDELEVISKNPLLNSEMGSPLQESAAALRGEWSNALELVPELRSAEGIGPAMALLERFANPISNAADPLAKYVDAGMNPGVLAQVRSQYGAPAQESIEITFNTAKKLRTLIFSLSESGQMSIGKGNLKKLNHALHGAMTDALETASPGLAKRFEDASAAFRSVADDFDSGVVQGLLRANGDQRVASMIVQNPESTGTYLRRLVGDKKMQTVERTVWEELLTKSTDRGVLVGSQLEDLLQKMRPQGQAALFKDPAHVAEIRDFAKFADEIGHTASLADKPGLTSFRGYLGPGVVGGAMGTISAVATLNPAGLLVAVPGFAASVWGPRKLARILATPGGPALAKQAMQTAPNTPRARWIATRLAAIAGAKLGGIDDETEE